MTDDLKKSFESAEPASFRGHGGNGEIFSKIEAVERWAKDERRQVATTVHENREQWLNEERQQVAFERQSPSLTLDPPNMPKKPIEQEAQERVSRKVQGLMPEVEAERARRIEDITQLPHATHTHAPKAVSEKQAREPAHPLKKETHAIVDRAQKVWLRANIHFNKMRSLFIADAEASGSETPVKDVYSNKNQRMKRIDKPEHRLLDKAFKHHGIDRVIDTDSPSLISAYETRIKTLEADQAKLNEKLNAPSIQKGISKRQLKPLWRSSQTLGVSGKQDGLKTAEPS